MPSIETPIRYKLRVQWRLVMVFTAILIISAFLVELFIVMRERNPLVQDAASYLVPLPEKIDWNQYKDVFESDYNTKLKLDEFLNSLDRDKVKVGSRR